MKTESSYNTVITVEAVVQAPPEKVWAYWTLPEHITKWCQASDDWHAPWAKNDLQIGGSFSTRMEAKDGSFGFEFGGVYDNIIPNELIEYTLGDSRKVKISFAAVPEGTKLVERFDAENTHPPEFQQQGWQAILNNFKNYTETNPQ